MKISNINEYEVYDLINHEVCLGIQGSFWFLIDDLIFHSPFDAFSIKSSIYDLINYPDDDMVEDLPINDIIDKLNEND